MAGLKIFAFLLLVSVSVCSAGFNASIFTNVGAIENVYDIREITCKVGRIQRNLTYELVTETEGSSYYYSSESGYPFELNITNSKLNLTIFPRSELWKPVKFTLNDTRSNVSFNYEIQNKTLTFIFVNSTDVLREEIHFNKTVFEIYQWKNFSLHLKGNIVELSDDHRVIHHFTNPYLYNLNYKFIIDNKHVAFTQWWIRDQNRTVHHHKVNVDQLDTYCWNSTHQNDTGHNETENTTSFTIMIDSQYRIVDTMDSDLMYLYNIANNTELTREFLNEFHSDIKENYLISKQLHGKILTSYSLSRNEISAKSKYLNGNTFKNIRKSYFELVKAIELVLSRFN